MINGIIGKKLGMTQVYSPSGKAEPVTVLEVGPCTVTQLKTEERDGYIAAQLGFGAAKKLDKAEKGHLKELGDFRHLREFRLDDATGVEVGAKVDASLFADGELIDVTGISKGHGFAGGVKRHGFHGGPKTHGQSDRHRAPGSIGSTTTPGRVYLGTRMAGHMGHEQITVQGLKVIKSDAEKNLLLVRGAVPGAKNGLILIKKSKKSK
jgi:large subunit ribosomal protein L3